MKIRTKFVWHEKIHVHAEFKKYFLEKGWRYVPSNYNKDMKLKKLVLV